MLKVRIIPTLLWKDLTLVKGKGFDSWRRVGTVLPSIKVYNTRDVDELILVDITATTQKHDLDYEEIKSLTAESFVPLTVGGGIGNLEQITRVLRAGADKVTINSATYTNPELVRVAVKRFGSQCVVASIDAKQSGNSHWCYSHAGTRHVQKSATEHAKHLQDLGAGEILLTSIDRDGTMNGYDLELIHSVCNSVSIPVIASGGAGNYQHMLDAIRAGASAVAAASIFHFTEQTPREAKIFLASHGIPVRQLPLTTSGGAA